MEKVRLLLPVVMTGTAAVHQGMNLMVTQPSPEHFAEAVEIFEALERVLASHLGYEEAQIGDALGYYGLF